MTHMSNRVIGVALSLCLGGAGARAGAAQDADPENAPLKIGPVELRPTLVFRNVGVDGNVFNQAENPKRDLTLTASPALEAVIRPPRTRLSYRTAADFVYFRTYSEERHINRSVAARVELDLAYVQPFASIDATQFRERPNTEIDLRARTRSRNYTAGLRLPLGPVVSATLGVRRQTSRYDPGEQFRGVDLASELNSETNAIDGTVAFELTPLTTVGLAVSKEEDRFDGSPLRDSDSLRVAPTISFKPYGPFSGSATVGWRRFDAVDPSVADYSGLIAGGTIGVVIVDRYHVETTFGRDIRYSYERDTPIYVWISGRGTLRMDLLGGVDVKVVGGRDVMAYKTRLGAVPAPPRDTHVLYGAGLGYNLRERIRIGIDAESSRRTSAFAPRGYRSNRVFASLAWGVRQQ
jgi:Putative beta-barrel porin 2